MLAIAVHAMCLGSVGVASAGEPVTFDLMQIEQVVAGVNGDTTAQAIQLRMRFGFQNLVGAARLVAYDAQGLNPIVLIDFRTSVPGAAPGDRVLAVSPGMLAHTDPTVAPDFILENMIPVSYLDAGRITYEDDFGFIYWSLAYGGASYTGSTTGQFTNDPNGDFGPPWPGPLPTTGQGLLFQGPARAASSSNEADYALTPQSAVLTNNAGESFTIASGQPCPCACDFDTSTGMGVCDIVDFVTFAGQFAGGDPCACDIDTSTGMGVCDIIDFVTFAGQFAGGCP